MTVVSIPTSIFVKKIVFAQRGIPVSPRTKQAKIKLLEDDEIFDLLRYSGQMRKRNKAQQQLTEWLYFEMSEVTARQVGTDMYAIGAYFDRYFKRELCKIAAAKSEVNAQSRVDAIRTYLNKHDIEDDEYSEEAATKRVQRYISEKKTAKTAIIPLPSVCKSLQFWQLYTDSDLEMMYQTYREQFPRYFLTAKQTERIKLPQQCRMWIFRQLGNYPPQYIAKKFNVDTSTVWRNIQAFEQEFTHRPKPQPLISLRTAI